MTAQEILLTGAREIGFELTAGQVSAFIRYLELLQEWSNKFNLTAITEAGEIVVKHFLDSLLLAAYVAPSGTLADVGTGAGFPGLPLKILYPELNVTLVDSLAKRVGFLEVVVSELGLQGVKVLHARAEDAGKIKGMREGFDSVAARAVSRMSVLCEYCLPLVKVGGRFIAAKGPGVNQEVQEAMGAIRVLGGKLVEIIETRLPGKPDVRTIAIIEKINSTPVQYPRKAGLPEKKPLEGT